MIRRSRNPRWLIPAALLSASALLASCSSGDTTDETGTPTQGGGEGAAGASKEEGIKLGVLGECEGPFGGFHEDTVAGVALALKEYAGATINSKTTALKGWEGAEINGTPIELVGIGCGDDTADTISNEIRQLVEQKGANVIIGPLSGDEGIAVAEYA
ncbi:MAG TPA: ABC transporter substrate-binding protein, partial [Nocardioidaceae bacterium]|nr:ABC transporter substrate-binding protein [Nocardioidaceae bacterium]